MSRCGMHSPGSGFRCDMITEDHRHIALVEWMMKPLVFHLSTLCSTQHLHILQAQARADGFLQFSCDDQINRLAVRKCVDQLVIQFGVQRDRFVGRQGPRRCGPDGDSNITLGLSSTKCSEHRIAVHRAEHHIDCG